MEVLTHRAAKSRRAMTLVEVLAVVVILGLIAATLTIGFSGVFGEAKHELAKTAIGVLVGKVETYRMKTNLLPPDDLGLAALSDGHARPTDSFYVSPDQLLDPWDRPFAIIIPGPDGHPYEIISYGADGQPGGEGENADVSSVSLRN